MTHDAPFFEGKLDDDLSIFLGAKLAEARQAQQELRQTKLTIEAALAKADKYVDDCETKLKTLGLNPSEKLGPGHYSVGTQLPFPLGGKQSAPSTKSVMANGYNPGWSHLDKIKYVLQNPSKYGLSTFKGANSVVKAIFAEEPNFRKDEKSAKIQIAPQISRVIKNGDAKKILALDSKVDYHFISAEWFNEDGQIKPQYKEAVKGLDLSISKDEAAMTADKKTAPADTGAE